MNDRLPSTEAAIAEPLLPFSISYVRLSTVLAIPEIICTTGAM